MNDFLLAPLFAAEPPSLYLALSGIVAWGAFLIVTGKWRDLAKRCANSFASCFSTNTGQPATQQAAGHLPADTSGEELVVLADALEIQQAAHAATEALPADFGFEPAEEAPV